MILSAIQKVVDGQHLTEQETVDTMNEIMSGEATPAQIACFITALRMKGETIEEITGAARVMREKATRIHTKHPLVVDTCGTGGDGSHTFNISTTAAFVVAGADLPVAKHGNRSVSSSSGSADVLKALGVNIDIGPEQVESCIDEVGIGFLFAPALHGAMKYAIGPRREIGIRTIFNALGPLTNPARAQAQVIGVYASTLTEPLANVLKNLGTQHAFVVHGADGLDEITTTTTTRVSELVDGTVKTYTLDPTALGIPTAQPEELVGGTPEENAEITSIVLKAEKGPKRDIVLLNAAAAIVAGGKANNLEAGLGIAAESIDSGKALAKLEGLKAKSNEI
ncbi:MAG: anthranilate phosphoribosyltransferase [Candidatus Poribacteria bacterium]|nr:anthranilate phosphoribosyltransferase [Candidatus Poribacteria bacterium]